MLNKVHNRATSIIRMLTGFSDPIQTTKVFLGRTGEETVRVRTRNGQFDLEVRGPMDVWCLKETLLDDVYRTHGFAIGSTWTVVDIGAGFGDFTILAARAASDGRVLAFEPFSDSFQLLERNVRRNEVRNVTASRSAVTGRVREVALDFSTLEPLQVKSTVAAPANVSVVPSVTMESLFEQASIDRIDLLKLDCEGCEYDVLMESPAAVIGRVDRIVMEYHDSIAGKTHDMLADYLTEQGFTVESEANEVHPDELGYLRASRNAADLR